MHQSANPSTSKSKKVYRFALYGRRSSGKTCLLAALAMPRRSHPQGLSCLWMGLPHANDLMLAGESGNAAEIVKSFQDGKEWLDKAISSIKEGNVPPPNPNQTPLRFLYEFSDPTYGSFLVKLIDYSGELIDPESNDEKELAKRLRQYMQTMDGILILAEVPRQKEPPITEQPKPELEYIDDLASDPTQVTIQPACELDPYEELERLMRAFALLRSEKQDGPALNEPVALLINKWDRLLQADEGFIPEANEKMVEQFLNRHPEPPHRRWVHSLQGVIAEGLFQVFPVSAFGKTVRDTNTGKSSDRPAQVNPLASFGLEDGFVWACQRRDQVDVNTFEQDANRLAWWKPWQLVNWTFQQSLGARAADLSKRIPAKSDDHRRVRAATSRYRRALLGQSAFSMCLLLIGYLLVGIGFDSRNYYIHQPTFANLQAASKEQVEQAEGWLEHYCKNDWFIHTGFRLVYWPGRASEQLVAIREWKQNAELAKWKERFAEVQRASDEVTKEALAKKLRDDLQQLPTHLVDESMLSWLDAQLQQIESNKKMRENRAALDAAKASFDQLIQSRSEIQEKYLELRTLVEKLPKHPDAETKELADERNGLLSRIDTQRQRLAELEIARKNAQNTKFLDDQERLLEESGEIEQLKLIPERRMPYPDVATAAINERQDNLHRRVENKIAKIEEQRTWQEFENDFLDLMRRGQLIQAAAHIVDKEKRLRTIQKMENIPPQLAQLKAGFREKCLSKLKENTSEYINNRQWNVARNKLKEVRNDKKVKQLLEDEELHKIDVMIEEVNVGEDKHLYRQVVQNKTLSSIDAYLNKAPLQTMKRAVEAYRQYLMEMEGELELPVNFSVNWGANCWDGYKNKIDITTDGGGFLKPTVTSQRNATSEIDDSLTCRRKRNDSISISINITVFGFFINDGRNHGQGSYNGSVRDLIGRGQTIKLDGNFGNSVRIWIDESALPQEPNLPAWRR